MITKNMMVYGFRPSSYPPPDRFFRGFEGAKDLDRAQEGGGWEVDFLLSVRTGSWESVFFSFIFFPLCLGPVFSFILFPFFLN